MIFWAHNLGILFEIASLDSVGVCLSVERPGRRGREGGPADGGPQAERRPVGSVPRPQQAATRRTGDHLLRQQRFPSRMEEVYQVSNVFLLRNPGRVSRNRVTTSPRDRWKKWTLRSSFMIRKVV